MAKIRKSNEPLCEYFKTPCREHGCVRWINVQGIHPQTGETINEWNCAHNWVPILLIDVGRQARSGAAATESFRNVVIALNNQTDPRVGLLESPIHQPNR